MARGIGLRLALGMTILAALMVLTGCAHIADSIFKRSLSSKGFQVEGPGGEEGQFSYRGQTVEGWIRNVGKTTWTGWVEFEVVAYSDFSKLGSAKFRIPSSRANPWIPGEARRFSVTVPVNIFQATKWNMFVAAWEETSASLPRPSVVGIDSTSRGTLSVKEGLQVVTVEGAEDCLDVDYRERRVSGLVKNTNGVRFGWLELEIAACRGQGVVARGSTRVETGEDPWFPSETRAFAITFSEPLDKAERWEVRVINSSERYGKHPGEVVREFIASLALGDWRTALACFAGDPELTPSLPKELEKMRAVFSEMAAALTDGSAYMGGASIDAARQRAEQPVVFKNGRLVFFLVSADGGVTWKLDPDRLPMMKTQQK